MVDDKHLAEIKFAFAHTEEFTLDEADSGETPAGAAAVLVFDGSDGYTVDSSETEALDGVRVSLCVVLGKGSDGECRKHCDGKELVHIDLVLDDIQLVFRHCKGTTKIWYAQTRGACCNN